MSTAAQNFGSRFRATITSYFGATFRVDLRQDGFTGQRTSGFEISRLEIEYGARGRFSGIIPSVCRVTIYDPDQVIGNAVALAKQRDWSIVVRRDGDIIWEGFMLPENISQPVDKFGRQVALEATDGTSLLSQTPYLGEVRERSSVAEIIHQGFQCIYTREATQRLNNTLTPFRTIPLTGEEILSSVYIDKQFLVGRNWRDILDDLLMRFGLVACYAHPGFAVYDLHALNADYRLQYVDSSGVRVATPEQTVTAVQESEYERLGGANREAIASIKNVEVSWERGFDQDQVVYGSNLVVNGGFDTRLLPWRAIGTTGANGIAWRNVDGDGLINMPVIVTGDDPLVRHAWQDVPVQASRSEFGLYFAANVRWHIPNVAVDAVSNARTQWALRFTSLADNVLWYDAATGYWTEDETLNVFRPSGAWSLIEATTEPLLEEGTVRIFIYEGADARLQNQPEIVSFQWDNVTLNNIEARDGQNTTPVTSVEDTSIEGLRLPIPSRAFFYGTTKGNSGTFEREITTDAAGLNRAFGWKVGRYNAGEQTTGNTIDEALGKHTLMWRRNLGQQIEMSIRGDGLFSPLRPFIYEGERYLLQNVRVNLLNREAHVLGIRIVTQALVDADIKTGIVIPEEEGRGGRGFSGVSTGVTLPTNGIGVLWRSGDPDDETAARSYALTGFGVAGQLLGIIDGGILPDYLGWVNPAGGLPPHTMANAGQVLKVNPMGNLAWLTDERGAGGSTLPMINDANEGQVLKVSSGSAVWANDANNTYSAGVGLDLTDDGVFNIDRPLPATTSDDAGKILVVNDEGDAYVLGNDANTVYYAGTGLTLATVNELPTFSHGATSTQASVNNSGRTVIQDITLDAFGHVTGLVSATLADTNTDTDTTYTAGTGLTLTGTAFAHADTSTLNGAQKGTAGQYMTGVTVDALGHVTAVAYGTPPDTNTDTDTTYTAGNGLALTGTAFAVDLATDSGLQFNDGKLQLHVDGAHGLLINANDGELRHGNTSDQASVNNSGRTVIQDITLDTFGHVTGLVSATLADTNTDTDTTYTAGTGLTLTGTVFAHADTSSQASVNNSGNTVVQDISLDAYGHVTGITSATISGGDTDTDTTYTAGAGLTLTGTVFSHTDTSNQSSVNNSGRTVIQDVTLDAYGHVTGLVSATLADTDTNTTYTVGAGLALTGTVFSHLDTSTLNGAQAVASQFVQSITVDTYGHVTAVAHGTPAGGLDTDTMLQLQSLEPISLIGFGRFSSSTNAHNLTYDRVVDGNTWYNFTFKGNSRERDAQAFQDTVNAPSSPDTGGNALRITNGEKRLFFQVNQLVSRTEIGSTITLRYSGTILGVVGGFQTRGNNNDLNGSTVDVYTVNTSQIGAYAFRNVPTDLTDDEKGDIRVRIGAAAAGETGGGTYAWTLGGTDIASGDAVVLGTQGLAWDADTKTLTHRDTSTIVGEQATADQFVQKITVDTFGHVTAVTFAEPPAAMGGGGTGDISGVTAGAGLTGGGAAGAVTLSVNPLRVPLYANLATSTGGDGQFIPWLSRSESTYTWGLISGGSDKQVLKRTATGYEWGGAVTAGTGLTLTGDSLAVTRPVPTGGTNGQVLKIVSGSPAWAQDSIGSGGAQYTFGNGLTEGSGDVHIDLVSNGGLEFASAKLQVNVGAGIVLTSGEVRHADTSTLNGAQAGSAGEYVTGFTVDALGHVTAVAYGTPPDTNTDTDTTYTATDPINISNANVISLALASNPGLEIASNQLKAKVGSGLTLGSTGIAHGDTSSINGIQQGTTGQFIQSVTVDDMGHVTAVTNATPIALPDPDMRRELDGLLPITFSNFGTFAQNHATLNEVRFNNAQEIQFVIKGDDSNAIAAELHAAINAPQSPDTGGNLIRVSNATDRVLFQARSFTHSSSNAVGITRRYSGWFVEGSRTTFNTATLNAGVNVDVYSPDRRQIGAYAFRAVPDDLTDAEKLAARTRLGAASAAVDEYEWHFGGTNIVNDTIVTIDNVGLAWDADTFTLSHKDTSELNGTLSSGVGTAITSITVDGNGHITGVTYNSFFGEGNPLDLTDGLGTIVRVNQAGDYQINLNVQTGGGLGINIDTGGLGVAFDSTKGVKVEGGNVVHGDTTTYTNPAVGAKNSGNTFIQNLTVDAYGHIQTVESGTATTGGGGGIDRVTIPEDGGGLRGQGTPTNPLFVQNPLPDANAPGPPRPGPGDVLQLVEVTNDGVTSNAIVWGSVPTTSLPLPPVPTTGALGGRLLSLPYTGTGTTRLYGTPQWVENDVLVVAGDGISVTAPDLTGFASTVSVQYPVPRPRRANRGQVLKVNDNNNNYGWADGDEHANVTGASSVNNSGNIVIQDIVLDPNGHVTSIGSTTIPVYDKWTAFVGGGTNDAAATSLDIANGLAFHVAGGAGIVVSATRPTNTLRANITTSGSDRKLKKDIEPLVNGIEKVKQLKPSVFTWAVPDGYPVGCEAAGFIAQDVQSFFPRAVCERSADPNFPDSTLHLNIHGLVAINSRALQELIETVESLQSKVASLQGE